MRLWQKIFLSTLVLVICAVELTALMLLRNTRQLLMEREQQHILTEYEYLAASVQDNVLYTQLKNNNMFLEDDAFYNAVEAVLQQQAEQGNTAVSFFCKGERIFSFGPVQTSLEERLLASVEDLEEGGTAYQIFHDTGGVYLLMSSSFLLNGRICRLVTTSDISELMLMLEQQMQQVQQISILCAVAISCVLLVMVVVLLRPLHRINQSTKQIAQGQYGARVQVRGGSEMAELAANMNSMANAIEENVNSLRQVAEDRKLFIDNLAHEMKTPLTSILGYADILRVKRSVTDEERREYAVVVVEETKRLRALSGKLMEIITVGSTQLEMREYALEQLFDEIDTALQPLLQSKGVGLKTQPAAAVLRIDPELFKSLLYNLIENAAKASRHGQEILLAAGKEDGKLFIDVIDHGIGIAAEDIKRVTQPFYMVDKSRSRKAGGAGLGLPLCVEIAAMHNARLLLQSEPGKGTKARILFSGGGKNG